MSWRGFHLSVIQRKQFVFAQRTKKFLFSLSGADEETSSLQCQAPTKTNLQCCPLRSSIRINNHNSVTSTVALKAQLTAVFTPSKVKKQWTTVPQVWVQHFLKDCVFFETKDVWKGFSFMVQQETVAASVRLNLSMSEMCVCDMTCSLTTAQSQDALRNFYSL